jgi:peptidoglycan/LPS O-acetylase OafA/YrhL
MTDVRDRAANRSNPAAADSYPPLPAQSRLDSLTGLRFFAAFGVFLTHFNGAGPGTGYGRTPLIYPQTMYGTHGVAFFFVLSGFVLTWMWRPEQSTGRFYWRRIARIVPLHLVTSVVALWVFYEPVSNQKFELGPYLLTIFLVQTWVPHLHPLFPGNGVSWTLSCEMFFYLCFPVIIALLAKRRRRHLVLVVVGLVAAALAWTVYAEQTMTYSMSSWSLRTPIFRIWEFILGIVLALMVRRGAQFRGTSLGVAVLLGAWILVYFNVRPHLPQGLADTVVYLDQVVAPLLFAWLLAVAARRDLSGRGSLLASKPLVLLGVWSFAFYLVHGFPLRLAPIAFGPRAVSNANIFDLIGMAVVGVALSAVFYYLVEHPAERRLRNLFSRRQLDTEDSRESQIDRAGEEAVARLR